MLQHYAPRVLKLWPDGHGYGTLPTKVYGSSQIDGPPNEKYIKSSSSSELNICLKCACLYLSK